jgi:acyl carrier protein
MDLNERIRAAVIEESSWNEPADALTDDYPLIDQQVLDSMSLFALVTRLEADFGITVPDEELLPENFETVETIVALVTRKQGG